MYLGEEGCDIYGNHPEVCRSFTCRWLEEDPLIEEAWRPDKCGFLLWKGKSFGRALVCLKVTREEANNSPEFREAVLRYGKGYRGKFSVMKKRGEGGTKNKNISEED